MTCSIYYTTNEGGIWLPWNDHDVTEQMLDDAMRMAVPAGIAGPSALTYVDSVMLHSMRFDDGIETRHGKAHRWDCINGFDYNARF